MKVVGYYREAREELRDALAVSPDPAAFRRAVDDALLDVASGLFGHPKTPALPVP